MDITLPVANPLLMTPRTSGEFLAVRKISFTPTAYTASVVSFLDSSTDVAFGSFSIPPVRPDGKGTQTLDFGDGVRLPKNASIKLATTNGAVGHLHLDVERISY